MKKLFLTLISLTICLVLHCQVPQGISYQAIAFRSNGTPVINSSVGVRISILDESSNGTILYQETHVKTTNAQGLLNLVIGQGTKTINTFSNIRWQGNKFLRVEIDPSGGTNYTSSGVNQLLTVPFAFYSAFSNSTGDLYDDWETWIWDDSTTVLLQENKKYFINADNVTLVFPKNEGLMTGCFFEIYIMQHKDKPRIITLNYKDSYHAGVLDESNNFLGFGYNQPFTITGYFQPGYNKIINIGDYWMCGGFTAK